MKTCTKCGESQPLTDFHRDRSSADGLRRWCKVCVKAMDDAKRDERNERARQRYAEDPASKIAKTRQYHLDHPEWSKERLRAHHEAHRDERYERAVERLKDPERREAARSATRRSESRRRAKVTASQVDLITRDDYEIRLAEFGGRCYICDVVLGADLHWDHFQPLAHGGAHVIDNLRPACAPCNVRKNACWPFTDERREEIKQQVLALRGLSGNAGSEVLAHGD